MKQVDERVAQTLNEIHRTRAETKHLGRHEVPVYRPGQKVWYRRPEGSGDKLDARWLGPAVIKQRTGQNSYKVQVGETTEIDAPAARLKPWVEDEVMGTRVPLYFHHGTTYTTGL